ncbi:SPX and EXS domain-containing protein 1-like isoform X1 [Papaver somniferum]|nr:SPX and EXS domain-containing protein 1-like isoform X1 [Papaver somniferum]
MRWFAKIDQTAGDTRRQVVDDAVAIFHPPFLLLGFWILISSIYSFMGYVILRDFANQLYPSTVLAIALYVLIPVTFSLYYQVNHESTFRSLKETLHAILCALFARGEPSFGEVFLADIITSMAKVFSDSISAMFLLIHLVGVPQVDAIFGPKSFAALVFTCLPFLLRLFQSLRLGLSGKTIHYWNTLKHLITMSVTVLSSFKFLLDDENTWIAKLFYPWIILGSLNTISCFVWDVKVDCTLTLTRRIPDRPVLRSRIFTEEQRWAWYVIVVADFFMRGSWTLRLSTILFTNTWIALLMSTIEIVRRSFWMMVRIEAQLEDMRLAAQSGDGAGNGPHVGMPLGP